MRKTNIILFDGICNFCNDSVNFIIDHDPKKKFKFAALQSEVGRQLLRSLGQDPDKMDSIVLIEKGKVFKKSTAALKVARYLSAPWPLAYGFLIVPVFIRNLVYDWIARNRYKWFGKREQCRMPNEEEKQRFLGENF
ncbi:thiol-disulfide oxidoreductase DCC family protein [Rapidithrix thailandica]|uniref:Thiol-disulfide oxidoreductase DCC family protein n=1 Tax=Rapidithrix thailandica TaxID=413964 RepID=A0AAW9RP70_9BACT